MKKNKLKVAIIGCGNRCKRDIGVNRNFPPFSRILVLIFSFALYIANVVYQYSRYGVSYPLDWDLPLCVYHVNWIIKYGPISFMVKNLQVGLFYLILAFFGFLSSNTKLTLIVLNTISALAYIYLFSELAFTITKSHSTAGLTALLASLSTNILNLYGVPSQLFAYVLLLLVINNISFISSIFSLKNVRWWLLVIVSSAICWVHWFFTYSLFLLAFAITFLFSEHRRNLARFGVASAILAIIPQLLGLLSYVSDLGYTAQLHIPVQPTLNLYLDHLLGWGGARNWVLFAVSIIGVSMLVKKILRERDDTALISLSWFVALVLIFHTCFLINAWYLPWNILSHRLSLLFPTPLLLALGMKEFYGKINNSALIKIGRGTKSFTLRTSTLMFILLISGPFYSYGSDFCAVRNSDIITWMDKQTYGRVLFVKDKITEFNCNHEPIFAFFNVSDGTVGYSSNIIGMEIGQHYVYYGKLGFLFMGLPTPSSYFKKEQEKITQEVWFKRLLQDGINEKILYHPIIIMADFYRDSIPGYLKHYQVENGIYIIPPKGLLGEEQNFPLETIECYRSAYNPTKDCYGVQAEWATSNWVLTHYRVVNSSLCEVYFPINLVKDCEYIFKVHLFDYGSTYSPLKFFLDDELIGIYNYSGQNNAVWVSFKMPAKLQSSVYNLWVKVDGEKQIFQLDQIVIEAEY